jgi:hypothetical protein
MVGECVMARFENADGIIKSMTVKDAFKEQSTGKSFNVYVNGKWIPTTIEESESPSKCCMNIVTVDNTKITVDFDQFLAVCDPLKGRFLTLKGSELEPGMIIVSNRNSIWVDPTYVLKDSYVISTIKTVKRHEPMYAIHSDFETCDGMLLLELNPDITDRTLTSVSVVA